MDQNTNLEQEEVIEELNVNTDIKEEDNKITDSIEENEIKNDIPVVLDDENASDNITVSDDVNTESNVDTSLDSTSSYETVNESLNEKKMNKTPIIILLSIFLLLDILALIIYIIGVDKVISFIK